MNQIRYIGLEYFFSIQQASSVLVVGARHQTVLLPYAADTIRAVVDISVAPDRQQWWPGAPTIDLNPQYRTQNEKHRALLPVLPLLDRWLRDEDATYIAPKPAERSGRGRLVNYHGRPVQDVDRAWDTMLTKRDMPNGREWRPYVLRHGVATLVCNRDAETWDLEGFMGHPASSQAEVDGIGESPTVASSLEGVISKIETLAPGALHRNRTGAEASLWRTHNMFPKTENNARMRAAEA